MDRKQVVERVRRKRYNKRERGMGKDGKKDSGIEWERGG